MMFPDYEEPQAAYYDDDESDSDGFGSIGYPSDESEAEQSLAEDEHFAYYSEIVEDDFPATPKIESTGGIMLPLIKHVQDKNYVAALEDIDKDINMLLNYIEPSVEQSKEVGILRVTMLDMIIRTWNHENVIKVLKMITTFIKISAPIVDRDQELFKFKEAVNAAIINLADRNPSNELKLLRIFHQASESKYKITDILDLTNIFRALFEKYKALSLIKPLLDSEYLKINDSFEDAPNEKQVTLVQLAVQHDSKDTLRWLLNAGAHIDPFDTPLSNELPFFSHAGRRNACIEEIVRPAERIKCGFTAIPIGSGVQNSDTTYSTYSKFIDDFKGYHKDLFPLSFKAFPGLQKNPISMAIQANNPLTLMCLLESFSNAFEESSPDHSPMIEFAMSKDANLCALIYTALDLKRKLKALFSDREQELVKDPEYFSRLNSLFATGVYFPIVDFDQDLPIYGDEHMVQACLFRKLGDHLLELNSEYNVPVLEDALICFERACVLLAERFRDDPITNYVHFQTAHILTTMSREPNETPSIKEERLGRIVKHLMYCYTADYIPIDLDLFKKQMISEYLKSGLQPSGDPEVTALLENFEPSHTAPLAFMAMARFIGKQKKEILSLRPPLDEAIESRKRGIALVESEPKGLSITRPSKKRI